MSNKEKDLQERKRITDENLFYEGMINPKTYQTKEYKAYVESLERKCKECKEKGNDDNEENCKGCIL
jgi:hypothetical protein